MEVAANQIDVLMKALRDALVDLNHARIFIRTREKMHPIGVKQFDETVDRLTALSGTAAWC